MRVPVRNFLAVVILMGSLLPAGTFAAEAYTSGEVGFHYQQLSWGDYAGDFLAIGRCLDVLPAPDEAEQVVGGYYATVGDTTTVLWYAAVLEADLTVDLALMWVRRAGVVLPPGEYPFDALGRTVMFVYVDGISDFTPPVDPVGADPAAWLNGLVCEHLFLAVSGSVHIQSVGLRGWEGTFSGTAFDTALMPIAFSDGMFNLEGVCIANETASWGDVKACFR